MDAVEAVDPALMRRVRQILADDGDAPSLDRVAAAVRTTGALLGDAGLFEVADAVRADLVGAGPLDALLSDERVTDVLVNGAAGVWVDRGGGLEPALVDIGTDDDVRRLAVRLATMAGRRLDDACPWVDARLPDGIRLHAVLPPVVHGGTHISLRLPRRAALGLDDLVAAGTVPPGWVPVMRALVEARAAYLVTGGTGVGKTTMLAALLGLVPETERVVVVEDAAELVLRHAHSVRLEARPANVEGAGRVSMTDLLRQALRMRPDRLVIGEVRGGEVRELLAALNTGHEGGCGTVHANASSDVPARLEALGALAGLERMAVHAQAASALDVVLHMRRDGALRRVSEIAVVCRNGGEVQVVPALVGGDHGDRAGPGWPQLAWRLGIDAALAPTAGSAWSGLREGQGP